jgi:hypothetical protein
MAMAVRHPLPAILALPFLAAATFVHGGCTPAGLAAPLASVPKFEPPGQTTCGVVPSPTRPLVVEWSALDRAALEARAKQGLVPVRYVGCHIEVLAECVAPSRYTYVYTPTTTKRDTVRIRNEDDLYSNLPLGAAKLEATLERAGELRVDMTIVGRYSVPIASLPRNELVGPDCGGATHVISGLTVGEFNLSAAGRASVSAAAGFVVGPSAQGSSSASQQELAEDGDEGACGRATGADTAPPHGCAAPLRIELTPVGVSQPVCPDGFQLAHGTCAPPLVRECDEGAHYVEGRGCVPDHAVPIASDCPAGYRLRDGWCVPPVSTECPRGTRFVPNVGCAPEGTPEAPPAARSWAAAPHVTAPIARRLPGPGPDVLEAESLYVSGDFAAATRSAMRGCEGGDGFGCGLAGDLLARGQGGAAGRSRGLGLIKRGCSMGDPWSCTRLGQ